MLGSGLKKNRYNSPQYNPQFVSFLARPKLGGMRSYGTTLKSGKTPGVGNYGLSDTRFKKHRIRKPNGLHSKMDSKKRIPDYTELAYREAVGRLRVLLNESYTPKSIRGIEDSGEDTDDRSMVSGYSRISKYRHHHTLPITTSTKRYPYYGTSATLKPSLSGGGIHTNLNINDGIKDRESTIPKIEGKEPPPELMQFIERQEDYIEQLERESQFCRDELAGLLGKVKEVISENETLHEKQKSGLLKSVYDHLETETEDDQEIDSDAKLSHKLSPKKSPKPTKERILEGPSIVFESRISELEAHLTQSKIDLKKAHEENDLLRRKSAEAAVSDPTSLEVMKRQIENLQRERDNLQDNVAKLQSTLSQTREKDTDYAYEAKGAVEQARWEKNRLEAEIRRLQSELQRVRDNSIEQARRTADEKDALDRRYTQQVDQLSSDLAVQWDTSSKLQLEIEKQKRELADLKRELAQKNALIDDYRKDLQSKTVTLQSEQSQSNAEKSSLEQELANARLAADRVERASKQDSSRLNAEISSLRQRLDRADADALHTRRENLRLAEQLASVEKELKITKLLNEDREKHGGGDSLSGAMPQKSSDEKELSSMIMEMEAKHVATVAELEGMIQSQNSLMEKLTGECHSLTQRLEEASTRHKQEMAELQTNLSYLNSKLTSVNTDSEPPHLTEDKHLYSTHASKSPNQFYDYDNNGANTTIKSNDNTYQDLYGTTAPEYNETPSTYDSQYGYSEGQYNKEQVPDGSTFSDYDSVARRGLEPQQEYYGENKKDDYVRNKSPESKFEDVKPYSPNHKISTSEIDKPVVSPRKEYSSELETKKKYESPQRKLGLVKRYGSQEIDEDNQPVKKYESPQRKKKESPQRKVGSLKKTGSHESDESSPSRKYIPERKLESPKLESSSPTLDPTKRYESPTQKKYESPQRKLGSPKQQLGSQQSSPAKKLRASPDKQTDQPQISPRKSYETPKPETDQQYAVDPNYQPEYYAQDQQKFIPEQQQYSTDQKKYLPEEQYATEQDDYIPDQQYEQYDTDQTNYNTNPEYDPNQDYQQYPTDQVTYDTTQQGYDSTQQGYDASQEGYDTTQGYDPTQQGYDATQPGYDTTQPGYDTTQQGYDTTQPGYDTTQPGYDATQQGYDTTQPGYDTTQQGYDATQQGYDTTQQGYDATQPGYDATQPGYDSTQPGYDATQQGYDTTQQGYDVTQPGYDTSQQGYEASQEGYVTNQQYVEPVQKKYSPTRQFESGNTQKQNINPSQSDFSKPPDAGVEQKPVVGLKK